MDDTLLTTYEQVYEITKSIPKGKVASYGQIAEILGDKHLCRVVGNALHNNPNPKEIPCHRVVNQKRQLAKNFALGGIEGQKEKLRGEGVVIVDNVVEESAMITLEELKNCMNSLTRR